MPKKQSCTLSKEDTTFITMLLIKDHIWGHFTNRQMIKSPPPGSLGILSPLWRGLNKQWEGKQTRPWLHKHFPEEEGGAWDWRGKVENVSEIQGLGINCYLIREAVVESWPLVRSSPPLSPPLPPALRQSLEMTSSPRIPTRVVESDFKKSNKSRIPKSF